MTRSIFHFISLFREAFSRYRLQMLLMGILGLLSGFLEAIGVNALIPLLSFAMGTERGADDFITRTLERFFIVFGLPFSAPSLLTFIVLLFVGKALAILFFGYLRILIRSDYELRTRARLLEKALGASWLTLVSQKIGHLETLLLVDVRMSAKLFEVLSDNLMLATSISMYLVVALNISWQITIVTLLIGGAVLLVVKPLLSRIRAYARLTEKLNKEVAHLIGQSVLGMKTVKSLRAANAFIERGGRHFDALRRLQIRSSLFGTLSTVFIQPLSVIFIAGVFMYSFSYAERPLTFAAFAALIYLIYRIFTYVQTVQGNIQHITSLTPYVEGILSFEKEMAAHPEGRGGPKAFSFERELRFDGVCFNYPGGAPVLENISFSLLRGTSLGIIGVSGVGKTTLFDLLLRLLDPTRGVISIDGVPIQEHMLTAWRQAVGYVSQDVFLLNDTIANNIRFFDESIRPEKIHEVADMARVTEFANRLPEKLTARVGERGQALSAGQRQRIAIARVLARDPSLLLLDEATSALDSESELAIQRAIEGLRGKVTVLIIAHRLSTVRNCDYLLVLDRGRIIEAGKPDELLRDKESHFYRSYHIRA